jgi:predicted ATPase
MLEAPLLSEGLRKLASILRLLQNGELRSTGLLLWDEPEANLNPRLTVVVANALLRLAENDVQVVLATHDYLLVETLALLTRSKAPTRYFVFHRPKKASGVEVEWADELDKLSTNPIRDEFLAHYDRLRALD